MRIGVPREIKNNESRVAITAPGVHELSTRGHDVLIQRGAGEGSGIADEQFALAGAVLVDDAEEAWGSADLLLKVKEPIASEYGYLRSDLTVFTYLHLAADRALTDALLDSGATGIAYETVQTADGALPLLAPMSEIAGRLAGYVGATQLMAPAGGSGLLMGGVAGTNKAEVVVIGGGVAGEHAAVNSLGLGARVTVVDVNVARMRGLEAAHPGLETALSTAYTIAELVERADLVIGSVLIPGAAAPKLVTDEMVAGMRPGSVLVDIAVDQGGCFEGSRPTTHDSPTFAVHESTFYCVANMPGSVARTSTVALTNATLPYVLGIAGRGVKAALASDPALARGLNVRDGAVRNDAVKRAFAQR
ncbi:alanine dehydrogenase [Leifsonia sp. 2MCAF36]|uniref:alanine dehydrogenase n=1 Tax=Leifsonia sp. 2MCAF36 TaxID=3232988 RepID=UPI003F9B6C85